MEGFGFALQIQSVCRISPHGSQSFQKKTINMKINFNLSLLKYVAHHSLLDDPKFFNAWCALAGLSQSGLTQWIAEYNYVNQRKKQHVHVQREDNGLPSKPSNFFFRFVIIYFVQSEINLWLSAPHGKTEKSKLFRFFSLFLNI